MMTSLSNQQVRREIVINFIEKPLPTIQTMHVPNSIRQLCGSIIPSDTNLRPSSFSCPRLMKYRFHSHFFYLSKQSIARPMYFIRFRNLGRNGLRVSQFGFGTWVTFGGQISDEVAEELVTIAYENGINFFDTAEVYAAGK